MGRHLDTQPALPVGGRQHASPHDGESLIRAEIGGRGVQGRLQFSLQIAEAAQSAERHHVGRDAHTTFKAHVTGRVTNGRGTATESGDESPRVLLPALLREERSRRQ